MKTPKKFVLCEPRSMSIHQLSDSSNIIIFGEFHNYIGHHNKNQDTQLSMNEFIRKFAESNPDQIIDLFLESEIPVSPQNILTLMYIDYYKYANPDTNLPGLKKTFDACAPKYLDHFFLKKYFYKCPKNLRVHLCDLRHIVNYKQQSKWTMTEQCVVNKYISLLNILNKLSYRPDLLTLFSCQKLLHIIHEFLYETNSVNHHTNIWKILLKSLKIDKQLDSIDPSYRNILKTYMKKEQNRCITGLKKLYPSVERDLHSAINKNGWYDASYLKLNTFFTDYSSTYMDVYLMGRVLRTISKKGTAIIYVGNAHAITYRTLLDKMKIRCIHKIPKSDKRHETKSCINVSSLLPLHDNLS